MKFENILTRIKFELIKRFSSKVMIFFQNQIYGIIEHHVFVFQNLTGSANVLWSVFYESQVQLGIFRLKIRKVDFDKLKMNWKIYVKNHRMNIFWIVGQVIVLRIIALLNIHIISAHTHLPEKAVFHHSFSSKMSAHIVIEQKKRKQILKTKNESINEQSY